MEEFRATLQRQIEESVSSTVEEIAEEDDDDALETSDEIRPKAWLEFSLILKEHLQVMNNYEAQASKKKKKNNVKMLTN
jgi:hypothetical protein